MELFFRLGLVLFFVFLNGYFVASEFSLVAVRNTRIDELVRRGNKQARRVQESLKNLDTYISATQLGITLASLALGWIGEPAIAHFLEPLLNTYLPAHLSVISAHGIAVIIAFSFITFLHIVFGELAPKTIALQKAETTALFIIGPLALFTKVFKPFIWILNEAGNVVLKLVGFKAPAGHQLVHSEEEIKMILAQSAKEGAIEKEEAEMVYSVLKFGDIPVKRIMIPKSKIIAFEKDTALSLVIKKTLQHPHSRFPVYDKTRDTIYGFVHIKDIYSHLLEDSKTADASVAEFFKKKNQKSLSHLHIIRKIPRVKKNTRIDDVLLLLQKKRVHIAVVEDDSGKTAGVVMLENVVENLVGEIQDEFDELGKKIA